MHALQPFTHGPKPFAFTASCIAAPAIAFLVAAALTPFLPIPEPHGRLVLLMAAMILGYAVFGGITLLGLFVERRLFRGKAEAAKERSLSACLLDPDTWRALGTIIHSRLAIACIASLLALLQSVPWDVPVGLGLFVGAITAVGDVCDWLLRSHRGPSPLVPR